MEFDKKDIIELKELIKSLFDFMADKGYTARPYPKIILDCKIQKEKSCIFVKTGYFDPNTNAIRIFMCDNKGARALKDILRTCAHEFVHHKQRVNGEIAKNKYKSDKISEDAELMKLEVPAYAFGNVGFREWTEHMASLKKKS